MSKFIFLTFAFLAWAFYEMSGGNEFQPEARANTNLTDQNSDGQDAIQVSSKSEPVATEKTPVSREQPAVTRVSFSQPNFDLRRPNEAEIAAVDPEVLASFGRALNDGPVAAPAVQTNDGESTEVVTDLRRVTGNRVNMRNGPGTEYSVVGRLTRGETVEVMSEPGNGWLKLRVSDSGRIGWMADFLVTAAN